MGLSMRSAQASADCGPHLLPPLLHAGHHAGPRCNLNAWRQQEHVGLSRSNHLGAQGAVHKVGVQQGEGLLRLAWRVQPEADLADQGPLLGQVQTHAKRCCGLCCKPSPFGTDLQGCQGRILAGVLKGPRQVHCQVAKPTPLS